MLRHFVRSIRVAVFTVESAWPVGKHSTEVAERWQHWPSNAAECKLMEASYFDFDFYLADFVVVASIIEKIRNYRYRIRAYSSSKHG